MSTQTPVAEELYSLIQKLVRDEINKTERIIKLEKRVKELEREKKQIDKPTLYFKMPLDKYGNLLFDAEETQVLHNMAVEALGDKYDIFTSWADVVKL